MTSKTKSGFASVTAAFFLCFVMLWPPPAGAQEADWHRAADADVVLQAMQAELERSTSVLKLDRVAAPYYIEYRVVDVDDYVAEAAYGALRVDTRTHVRFLRVAVRVGDYKQDGKSNAGAGALGMVDFMPLDGDLTALRHQLWLATDRAYREAAEALASKQAQLKQFTIDQPVDDFAHADPVHFIGTLARLDFDPQPWTKMLQEASVVYKTDPQIESFDSNLKFSAVNDYFANSEGTVVRSGRKLYQMYISCSTQAADGMSLPRNNGFVVNDMKNLPSEAEFIGRAEKLARSLKEMRDAPVADEEYRGPVLFSADASATVFADLVGDNVLGRRPDLGKTSRTTGAFATSYKSRVLPDFLSVVDDPTIWAYRGKALLGHYEFDDEGVPAQRVPVIEKGILVNYLIGREPIRDFPTSNGHARARVPATSPGPTNPLPHVGSLIVTSAQPASEDELSKKFLDLCRQRDLPYCYFVETFGPKLIPRLLYKVWAKDGRQELVRGGSFGDLDVRALRGDLIAAGDDAYVDNHPLNVPHTIVAPSILFDELEIKRATTNQEKLPEYPPPALVTGK
jgi:microcin-processing metallopeptidase PmbA/TldD-like protein